MKVIKVALTGGIACGKSLVSRSLKSMGIALIDLDKISREVSAPNTQGLKELVSQFGGSILLPDQSLNREALRKILFKNSENQKIIEHILHPKILEKMQMDIQKLNQRLVIVEVPLLIEKNLSSLFDRAIVVNSTKQNQLKRLIKRDHIDQKLAEKILSVQASPEQRLNLAKQLPTDIIDNNSDIIEVEKKAHDLGKKLLNL
ncbi:MAG: dephospho-CoA kinase [Proteobacteria bacterium]|nr:dephospho-CoA kinase [Pseudomonadota bacterium]MCH9711230.1 dephospho-CoA kinase [Pseudomonadota bacterium]MCH9749917.1 dephospho-CoA kinase [Pseudomonadota bacterium]